MTKSKRETEKIQLARPFVKWVGGKRQLLPELRKRVPDSWSPDRDPYAELFVGSGALYFELRPRRALVCDLSQELVAVWKAVRDDVVSVIHQLRSLERRYRLDPEPTYYEVRGWRPADLGPSTLAARFILLNKAGFNGLYRVNKLGLFNSPWGRNPAVTICDAENLQRCSDLMREGELKIECGDFDSARDLKPGTLVYLDPPYVPRTPTANFRGFNQVKFSRPDHDRLAKYAREVSDAGCHVVVSQSDDEQVAQLYRDRGFTVELVDAVRMVNSCGYARGRVGELIISRRASR
jgi:DNA adenine methylase